MTKKPWILVAGAVSLIASGGRGAAAQDVTVLASPLPAPPGQAAYSVQTLAAGQLANQPADRLDEVLKQAAGFQLFRRAGSRTANPTAQGPTLRALGGNAAARALVLLDGVPQDDPFGGWISWDVLTPDRLGWARITRGGGAGAFGNGALAGTIELNGRPLDRAGGLAARAEYGSYDSWLASAMLDAPLGRGAVGLSARMERSDGFILIPADQRGSVDVPAKSDSWSVEARGVAPLGDTTSLSLRAVAFEENRLAGLEVAPNRSLGVDASARLAGEGHWRWEALAYVKHRVFESGFGAVASDRSTASASLDQYNVPATGVGGKLELRPPVGEHHVLQLGMDVRAATGETHERFRNLGSGFTRQRLAGGDALTLGAFLEDSWTPGGGVTLTGGVRLDHWRFSGGRRQERDIATGALTLDQDFSSRSGTRASGRAAIAWAPTTAINLRAAAYTSLRTPTLNELYRPFRVGNDVTEANAALKPERLKGAEVGLRYQPIEAASIDLTLFDNRIEDAIGNVSRGVGPGVFPSVGFLPAGGVYRVRDNLDEVRSRGIEARGHLAYGGWRLEGAYAYADAEVRTADAAPGLEGLALPQAPRHAASLSLAYEQATFGLMGQGTYSAAVWEDDLNTRRLDEALTLDAQAWVNLTPSLTIRLRGQNITDAQVDSAIAANGVITRGAPRTLWVGLSWSR